MFGHQVIEGLRKSNGALIKGGRIVAFDKDAVRRAHLLAGWISESQHFHGGNAEELLAVFSRIPQSTRMFLDPEVSEGVRLPYEKCWFDFLVENVKVGILVVGEGDEFLAWPVFFDDAAGNWILVPFHYVVSIGHTLDQSASWADKGPWHGANVGHLRDTVQFTDAELLEHNERWQFALQILNCILLLLSCKNIEVERTPAPDALNKKRAKQGKQPLFSYHTLVLKPVGKQQESTPKHLWDNRLHLCRGHFKNYTEEKPLFGSITGRFWWQPCVRGNKKKGIVLKDYDLSGFAVN